jgi:hypothetical protein
MQILTRKEILAELKRLGINSPAELDMYRKEYESYYFHYPPHNNFISQNDLQPLSSKK